ncbi:MAG: caspase family protein, partial [Xanthobacteraceae bacterium]
MSLRTFLKLAALASTCWMSVGQALAENRIALVIGNSNYTSVTALPNPANDAKAMTNFLSSAGFQVVQAPDLTQSDMRTTIADFAKTVSDKGPDTVALVFYAGHGLQVDGENFLVPVDARIEREADVPLQATRLADLMNALSSVPSKSRIVILDACR